MMWLWIILMLIVYWIVTGTVNDCIDARSRFHMGVIVGVVIACLIRVM